MEYEYEGRTEREAIEKAASDLDLERDQFDVEILESQKGTLFKKGFVRIRVVTAATPNAEERVAVQANTPPSLRGAATSGIASVGDDTERTGGAEVHLQEGFETEVADFVAGVIERMGYTASICAQFREPQKVGLRIDSMDCALIIGRKGATLDALQLLANVYASKLGREDMRVILDCQNYRIHREEQLVRLAYNTADRVASTKRSILLEPMNPFERRIIHTTLGDVPNISTKSEGNGVYKRVRIMWRGMR